MTTGYLMLHFHSRFLPREGQKIHCILIILVQVQAFVFNVSFEKRFYSVAEYLCGRVLQAAILRVENKTFHFLKYILCQLSEYLYTTL